MTYKKDHKKEYIKLEELPKKSVFSTPDGYFDKLPAIIQQKAVDTDKVGLAISRLPIFYRLAGPALALVMVLTYFALRPSDQQFNVEAMLDEVSTTELVGYLNESDISTEELLSMMDLEEFDTDGMTDEIELLNDDEMDDILNEFDNGEFELEDYEI